MIANTPTPPYYAVIFTSTRTEGNKGYLEMAKTMLDLAQEQKGFLGFESARDELGISVSYWKDIDSIEKWRANAKHQIAKNNGKEIWYKNFKTRIAKVEKDY